MDELSATGLELVGQILNNPAARAAALAAVRGATGAIEPKLVEPQAFASLYGFQVAVAEAYRDDLEVEWAGHPSWYFQISKFSISWLKHRSVPETTFLHELDRLPADRECSLLKPLFSFAGGGIMFAPTDAQVAAIPEAERRNYILQKRIQCEPVIETPEGPAQAEIRIMYVRNWVGASAGPIGG